MSVMVAMPVLTSASLRLDAAALHSSTVPM